MNKSIDALHREKAGKVSDKWESYLGYYDQLFAPLRDRPLTLLEIGVQNGGSLEVWSRYFASAERLIGCDIDPKCGDLKYEDPRISVIVGDANELSTFQKITSACSAFDLVIDDGSHMSHDILNSFINYFPLVKPGGVYVVEDTHALYFDAGGDGLLNERGAYAFFKKLVDVINYQFWNKQLQLHNWLRPWFAVDAVPQFIAEGWVDAVEFRNSIITIHKARQPGHEKLGTNLRVGDVAAVQDWGGTFVPPVRS